MPAPSSTTLIDAVDEANEPVGTVRREDVFRVGANFRTVHVLVFNRRGELLLQRLSASRKRHRLLWGSSVAGYLHAGESYEEGARRRIREELGIEPHLTSLGVTAMEDEGVTKFVGVFCAVSDHATNAAPEEIDSIEFWSRDRLEAAIHNEPEQFTASLRHVMDFWDGRQQG